MKKLLQKMLCLTLCAGIMGSLNTGMVYAEEPDIIPDEEPAIQTVWDFGYTGQVQTWTVPKTGVYKLTTIGASGSGYNDGSSHGGSNSDGGQGGYVSGEILLLEGQSLYIVVGSEGVDNTGGYNGGGNGRNGATAGGGATHIATANRGLLTNYSSYKDDLLMIAGGGGGLPSFVDNYGGSVDNDMGSGGTLLVTSVDKNTFSNGYAFGLGQDAQDEASQDGAYSGAGGGGFYGGRHGDIQKIGQRGYGGSSFIDTEKFGKIEYTSGVNLGNGSASIEFLREWETTLMIDLNSAGTVDGKDAVQYTMPYNESFKLPIPDTLEEYDFLGYEIVDGDGEISEGTYTFKLENTIIRAKYLAPLTLKAQRRQPENELDLIFSQPDDFMKFYRVYQSTDKQNWTPVRSKNDSENYNLDVTYTSNTSLTVQRSGRYLITVSGARGGNAMGSGTPKADEGYSLSSPSNGITATGTVWLKKGTTLVVRPGSQGGTTAGGAGYAYGGNGQFRECCSHFKVWGGGGGGGTGISVGSTWIATAAGGAGAWGRGYGMSSNPGYAWGGAGGGSTGNANTTNVIWKTGLSTRTASVAYGYARIQYIDNLISEEKITDVALDDKAAPDPVVDMVRDESGNTTSTHLTWEIPDDNGTQYWFKAMSYLETSDDPLRTSNIVDDTYTSGVKGFYYYVDTNPTGTVTRNHSFVAENKLTLPQYPQTRWIHIATVDNAGNLSTTYHFKILSIAKYTVNHYAQNEDGSYTLVETEEFMDTIGKTVTPDVHTQTGRDNPPLQSVVITGDGQAVVNYYYDVTRFDINGTVQWNDHSNLYNTRPEDIKVTLYRDGEYFDEVMVSAADNSNPYSFTGLQKYDLETGREFVYTVEQETAYSQAALATSEDKYLTKQNGFNFLNTINNTNADKPEIPDHDNPDDKGFYVEGNIYWEDNEDSLGFRPSTITITLYQKGDNGEFKEFDLVIVDANTENYYLFDWLPKYWYDEDGMPTKYEYKVEETFTAWYVENGIIKDAYEIYPDTPDDIKDCICNFTNVFVIPDNPIIPVNEYTNTLTVVTNTNDEVRIILKPEELIINSDYSVSYGDPTGKNIPVLTDKTGMVITDIPSTRYEIIVDSPEYTIEDMNLVLNENMELEKVGDKWYLIIKNQPADTIGTLEIELLKNIVYYQERDRISNYFACPNKDSSEAVATNAMSLFGITAGEELDVDSEDKDKDMSESSEIFENDVKTTEEISEEKPEDTTMIEESEGNSTTQEEGINNF